MIAWMNGHIQRKCATECEIMALGSGICYRVLINDRTCAALPDHIEPPREYNLQEAYGKWQCLFIHEHITETAHDLIGFLTREELALFRLLLTVSGIGCTTALAIVGLGEPKNIRQAIRLQNTAYLRRAKRLGEKGASNICLALAGKVTEDWEE